MMLKNIKLIALFSILSLNTNAISTTTNAKIADGVALERIPAYQRNTARSTRLGFVEPGTTVYEHKKLIKTKPGLATMEEKPKDMGVPFQRGSTVEIWEYLEEGYSKIFINGNQYTAKIARSITECNYFPANPKYCWADVIEEPEYYEWLQISLQPNDTRFWVLNRVIDGSGIISVKDEAVVQSRVVKTTFIPENEVMKKDDQSKKQAIKEIEAKQEPTTLVTPDMYNDVKMPEDPMARKFVEDMLKPKSVLAKEKAEARKKQEAEAKQQQAPAEISQDDMFKQQKLDTNNSLNANMNSNSTELTIQAVNKETTKPATKLDLKKNQAFTLPAVEYTPEGK